MLQKYVLRGKGFEVQTRNVSQLTDRHPISLPTLRSYKLTFVANILFNVPNKSFYVWIETSKSRDGLPFVVALVQNGLK